MKNLEKDFQDWFQEGVSQEQVIFNFELQTDKHRKT